MGIIKGQRTKKKAKRRKKRLTSAGLSVGGPSRASGRASGFRW